MANGRIENLEDVKQWIAATDATNKLLREQQTDNNSEFRADIATLFTKVTSIEKKLMFIAGVSSGIGAVLGSLLSTILVKFF